MADRIQLRRTKGWRMPPNAVKVDRSTRWGNPWKPGEPGQLLLTFTSAHDLHELWVRMNRPLDARAAVDRFGLWIHTGRIDLSELESRLTPSGKVAAKAGMEEMRARIRAGLPGLRGRTLACWCPVGSPCHADVLMELANG